MSPVSTLYLKQIIKKHRKQLHAAINYALTGSNQPCNA
jgi:hypothetical protein